MLLENINKYTKPVLEHAVLDFNGLVLKSDNGLFSNLEEKNIAEIHPFFETILPLLGLKNEAFTFSCIHLNIESKTLIADVILNTFDADKKPLLIIHDLTAHYNNYQTTTQVKNENILQSEILELQNNFLKEKEAFKNAFIANFSHELRDPLTGILTFTDVLKKSELNNKQEEYIQTINTSSNFLRKMIDDILDISNIESGKIKLIIEPFNLLDLLQDIKYSYSIIAKEKNLEFNCNFDAKLPKIVGGDAKRLKQVLTNLVDNAIKFTNKGSVSFNVSLNQIRAQKASIHFEVIDTGIGIKKEHIDSIFTSFTQLNHSDAYKGTGLGLAIVKHLVELTNSKISVESKFGKGSTFSTNVTFLANPSLKVDDKKAIYSTLNTSKKYNILLVEDSEITQLSVLKILASQGHFFLDIVSKPSEVLDRITNPNNEVDLVLMDIKLKEHRGDEIVKSIRKLSDKQQKKIKIIAVTGKVFKEDLKLYKKAGINAVLKKPFNEDQLLKAITKQLK